MNTPTGEIFLHPKDGVDLSLPTDAWSSSHQANAINESTVSAEPVSMHTWPVLMAAIRIRGFAFILSKASEKGG
jgi:hypothetical protein